MLLGHSEALLLISTPVSKQRTSACTSAYCSLPFTATARLAGIVHGVVVQMAIAAPSICCFRLSGMPWPAQPKRAQRQAGCIALTSVDRTRQSPEVKAGAVDAAAGRSAACGRRTWRVHRQGDIDAARGVALWVLQFLRRERGHGRQQISAILHQQSPTGTQMTVI